MCTGSIMICHHGCGYTGLTDLYSLYFDQREFARAHRSLTVGRGAYSFAIVLESVGGQYLGKLEGG